MIEKEIKKLLSIASYRDLLTIFAWQEVIQQVNHYYLDSDCVLYQKNISVRIREKDNILKLQVKKPLSIQDGIHIKEEYSEVITSIPSQMSVSKISEITELLLSSVELIGSLRTQRHIYSYDLDTTIYLDQNNYLGHVDYELEIEYEHDYPTALVEYLQERNIVIGETSLGKYRRFVKKYLEQKLHPN